MNDCPVPDGYDAGRVRPSIEGALKNLGYSGPVTITAYGDLTQILGGLSSTGVTVQHTAKGLRCSYMYSDLMEWREHNPPPATIMLISDQVQDTTLFSRLQEFPYDFHSCALLQSGPGEPYYSQFSSTDSKTPPREVKSAMLHCRSCGFDTQTLAMFTKHLSGEEHAQEETSVSQSTRPTVGPEYEQSQIKVIPRNCPAPPEYATSKTAVWWDMRYCPVPLGYDAGLVRPSIEGALKNLGYNGPVTINAYGDITQTPEQVLRGLSSTGVAVQHTIEAKRCSLMFANLLEWKNHNPPPATIMLITDQVDVNFFSLCPILQRCHGYKLVLAYASTPTQASVFVTSAEWLWGSLLLTGSATPRPFASLRQCSQRDSKTSPSEVESAMFHCRSCFFDGEGLEIFTKHLSGEEHAQRDIFLNESIRQWAAEWKARNSPKSRRLRKAFRTGFRLGYNLRLSNRRGARKEKLSHK